MGELYAKTTSGDVYVGTLCSDSDDVARTKIYDLNTTGYYDRDKFSLSVDLGKIDAFTTIDNEKTVGHYFSTFEDYYSEYMIGKPIDCCEEFVVHKKNKYKRNSIYIK